MWEIRLKSIPFSFFLFIVSFILCVNLYEGLTLTNTAAEIFEWSILLCILIFYHSILAVSIIAGSILLPNISKLLKNPLVVSIIYSLVVFIPPIVCFLYGEDVSRKDLTRSFQPLLVSGVVSIIIPFALVLSLYFSRKTIKTYILIIVYDVFCLAFIAASYFIYSLKNDYVLYILFFQNTVGLFLAKWVDHKLKEANKPRWDSSLL